jgi:hypothetical protein
MVYHLDMQCMQYLSMKRALFVAFAFLTMMVGVQAQDSSKEQKKNKAESVKQLLESKEYVFKAQSVNPARGAMRQLTSEYDVRLLGDSLVSYLPYFGRAYSAPINPNNAGIQFTSTQFDYAIKQRKKGWDITLRPRDESSVQQLVLSVTESGRAMLQVISTNREAISFQGYVAARS